MSEYKLAHFFADYGVESEVLSSYGSVVRYTIDPVENSFVDSTVEMDLMEKSPDEKFDLGLFHPKCTRWSQMTSISGDESEHENQIPRSREIAESVCDDYIIENKSNAPLENPVVLNGKMFALPIHYERAFETTFPVRPKVKERGYNAECSTYFSADRTKEWWKSVKGYYGEYPKEHLVKNCVPAIYLQTILRHWLKSVNERDSQKTQSNSGSSPRKLSDEQITLKESGVEQ